MKNNSIITNAVEFLLFNYFGLSREDGNDLDAVIDCAVARAYFDATNQDAFNALFTVTKFPDREAVDELKARVKGMSALVGDAVKTLYFSNDRIDFDEWHKLICTALLARYGEICDELDSPTFRVSPEAYGFFSYGNAQKWVNMTIKNLYIISGAYLAMGGTDNEAFFNAVAERANEYHIPLDNVILGAVYKQKLIGRHLADARQEDIDDKASEPRVFDYYSDLDAFEREEVRLQAIEDAYTTELIEELESRGYVVTKDK